MSVDSTHPLATTRLVIGHLTVCQGCCCGNTENGRPPVPVEWLKKEWRSRGLLKRVQLTISGCPGPCDVPNVVTIGEDHGHQQRSFAFHPRYRGLKRILFLTMFKHGRQASRADSADREVSKKLPPQSVIITSLRATPETNPLKATRSGIFRCALMS
jgi:hypothetical protein